MKIIIINGPNLNLLGKREVKLYGNKTFDGYFSLLKSHFKDIELDYFQSNWEGEIIDKLHEINDSHQGVVINAAAYTHTSIAIADAIKAIKVPAVEVHMTNILNREEFRQTSLIAPSCIGSISGFGLDSYRLGIESLRLITQA